MSTATGGDGPNPYDSNLIEQARRQINRLAEEIAHLSEMDLAPAQYYGEFLQRLLTAIAAPAGAVWLRTQQGNLQLQYQINMQHVGLNRDERARETHNKLLEEAFRTGQPKLLPPQSSAGPSEGGAVTAGNPTDFVILIAPILVDKQVEGLVEIWQDPHRGADAQRGFLQFIVKMASLASGYTRNYQLRQMVGQQQVWTSLEAFARQVHGSLNPTEVAYQVANEGRRLVECDRVSVGVRQGKRVKIEAISGADVVEKRSNLVVLMRKLMDSVLAWDEKLIYTGVKDETLPPNVITALDAYLHESNSKLLVCLPLRDEREAESGKPARSAILMESFEPSNAPEQLVARLEVVGRHSTAALYNAAEHKRIPMRFLWVPLAKVQEGLGGKARAILTIVGVLVVALVLAMIFVPYPLRMEANGQLVPRVRMYMYSPADEGNIKEFPEFLKTGKYVHKGQELIRIYSSVLATDLATMQGAIDGADRKIILLQRAIQESKSQAEKTNLQTQLVEAKATLTTETQKLREKRELFNADPQRPGHFWLRSPLRGEVLTGDFRDLVGSNVKPSQPLLRIGQVDPKVRKIEEWEIELKIPQKNVGQVLTAYNTGGLGDELDVDLLLAMAPTKTFKGKLKRSRVASEASPNKTENNESEPVVLAWVRIHAHYKLTEKALAALRSAGVSPAVMTKLEQLKDKEFETREGLLRDLGGMLTKEELENSQALVLNHASDIPADYQLPPNLLLTGTEVHSRVRCGNRAMGYSLFYGVWEFIYENIVFFF